MTDEMIKELETILIENVRNDEAPILSSSIIYEWHSDWSDLTEKCSYKNFPIWRTKHARESMMKRMRAQEATSLEGKEPTMSMHRRSSTDLERSNSSKKSKHKTATNSSLKLTSILENKNPSVASSSNMDMLLKRVDSASHSSFSKIPGSPLLISMQKSRNEMGSRLTQNTNNQIGCFVNYQLSNFYYKEKGWTVYSANKEDQLIDNKKKALFALHVTMCNM